MNRRDSPSAMDAAAAGEPFIAFAAKLAGDERPDRSLPRQQRRAARPGLYNAGGSLLAAPLMRYHDLRDFMSQLEKTGELKRVGVAVDTRLEMTEICDRVLRAEGPAILFEKPKGHTIPVLANLFGTPKRVALGMGEESVQALREVGKLLAYLKEPEPPKGLKDAWDKLPILKQVQACCAIPYSLR